MQFRQDVAISSLTQVKLVTTAIRLLMMDAPQLVRLKVWCLHLATTPLALQHHVEINKSLGMNVRILTLTHMMAAARIAKLKLVGHARKISHQNVVQYVETDLKSVLKNAMIKILTIGMIAQMNVRQKTNI